TVLAPSSTEQGECIFDIFKEDTFTLEYRKPSLPPKSQLLPQSDVIFRVEKGTFREVLPDTKVLLFGIRSCDLMGLRQSSSFMSRDTQDIYYRRRSDHCLKVVMACAGPQNETCFCTTTRSGPYATIGFDLQFYDLGDSFLVESGSPEGDELLKAGNLADVDDKDTEEQVNALRNKAVAAIREVPDVNRAMEILASRGTSDELWERFGDKCIVCGGCVYVCPTCTCFTVADFPSGPDTGERIRSWDTCLYGGFTKEASGHNPRSTQGLRLKRRHEHKLLYFNQTDVQEALCGCVGCGRCSDYCPVHIGTLEVVRAIVDEQS
ncbi:MAG: 4Fe-4S dicluster domain-containing protein, partial [Desulfomonilia bacterium]|nr:4Fe-4S dicluster domain-containing protein [Desulfomonilia bacterium]